MCLVDIDWIVWRINILLHELNHLGPFRREVSHEWPPGFSVSFSVRGQDFGHMSTRGALGRS